MPGPAHSEDLPLRANPAPPSQVSPHLDPRPRRSTGVAALVSTPPRVLGITLGGYLLASATLAPNSSVSLPCRLRTTSLRQDAVGGRDDTNHWR